jgi:hypothetical protein
MAENANEEGDISTEVPPFSIFAKTELFTQP